MIILRVEVDKILSGSVALTPYAENSVVVADSVPAIALGFVKKITGTCAGFK